MKRQRRQRGQALVAALVTMALLFAIAGGLAMAVSAVLQAQGSSTTTYLRDTGASSTTAAIVSKVAGGSGACPSGTVFNDPSVSSYSCNWDDLVAPRQAATIALQWSGNCATGQVSSPLTGHVTAWLNARQTQFQALPTAVYIDGSGSGCVQPSPGPCVASQGSAANLVAAAYYLIYDCPVPATPYLHVVGSAGSVWVARAATLGSFVKTQAISAASPAPWPYGIGPMMAARLHGPTQPLDLIVANRSSGSISVFTGNGSGAFSTAPTWTQSFSGFTAFTVGDFGNGRLDLAVTSAPSTLTVLTGNGNGAFAPAATATVGLSPVAVTMGHFSPGTSSTYLAVANSGSGSVSIVELHWTNGNLTLSGGSCPVIDTPTAVAAADFTGSGADELALVTSEADGGDVWIFQVQATGTGSWACSGSAIPLAGAPGALTVGRFDGSGAPELAVALPYQHLVQVLLHSSGGLTSGNTFAINGSPTALTTGHFGFGPGDDLAITYRNGAPLPNGLTVLIARGNGTFLPVRGGDLPAGLDPAGVAAGNYDGSATDSLAVASSGDGTISILLRNHSKVFSIVAGAADGSAYNEADLVWTDPNPGGAAGNSLLFEGGL